jgi:hypothetical protein
MGDVNGDGVDDFLVTSDGNGRGKACVVTGSAPAPRSGDTNADCAVNFTDVITLISDWGPCPPPPAFCRSDFNDDGVVDFADLLIILQEWD